MSTTRLKESDNNIIYELDCGKIRLCLSNREREHMATTSGAD